MKHSYRLKKINKNYEDFSCQSQSFRESNFQGALLLQKENLR